MKLKFTTDRNTTYNAEYLFKRKHNSQNILDIIEIEIFTLEDEKRELVGTLEMTLEDFNNGMIDLFAIHKELTAKNNVC